MSASTHLWTDDVRRRSQESRLTLDATRAIRVYVEHATASIRLYASMRRSGDEKFGRAYKALRPKLDRIRNDLLDRLAALSDAGLEDAAQAALDEADRALFAAITASSPQKIPPEARRRECAVKGTPHKATDRHGATWRGRRP